jgi:hypothetical protein
MTEGDRREAATGTIRTFPGAHFRAARKTVNTFLTNLQFLRSVKVNFRYACKNVSNVALQCPAAEPCSRDPQQ